MSPDQIWNAFSQPTNLASRRMTTALLSRTLECRRRLSAGREATVLHDLARRSSKRTADGRKQRPLAKARALTETPLPNMEAKYRALVEQIPAVVFMAYLDEGIGEAYVSPQIEAVLGFTQEEWLQDPVRWYRQVHPDDKQRWSVEAAELFLSGKPLRSAYRVIARDGRVIWFHCEAKMIRRRGRPSLVHSRGGIRHHRSEEDGRGAYRRSATSSPRFSIRWVRW